MKNAERHLRRLLLTIPSPLDENPSATIRFTSTGLGAHLPLSGRTYTICERGRRGRRTPRGWSTTRNGRNDSVVQLDRKGQAESQDRRGGLKDVTNSPPRRDNTGPARPQNIMTVLDEAAAAGESSHSRGSPNIIAYHNPADPASAEVSKPSTQQIAGRNFRLIRQRDGNSSCKSCSEINNLLESPTLSRSI